MIPEWISGFVVDVFRWVLWFCAHFILRMTDFMYNVILSLFNLHLGSGGEYQWIWDFYSVVVTITGLFILFRLVVALFKSALIEDTISKIGSTEMVTRILSVGLVLSLIPVLMPILSTFASSAATHFPTFFNDQVEMLPSDIIINSGLTDFDDTDQTITIVDIPEGTHAIDFITTGNIINKKDDEKNYVYMPNTENIAWTLLLAACTGYVFLFVSIQIVTRLIGLFLKIALAPYALSGLVDPNDNAPSLWFRLCMSDFLVSFFQMVSIWIAMAFATHIPAGINGIGRGIIFVGAIFSIMIAPSGVAQLLGNDTGAQSGMQMIQSAMALGRGVQIATVGLNAGFNAAGHVVGGIASGATTVGAAGIYAAGRALGARSLNPNSAGSISGGTGGNSHFDGGSSGGGIAGENNYFDNGSPNDGGFSGSGYFADGSGGATSVSSSPSPSDVSGTQQYGYDTVGVTGSDGSQNYPNTGMDQSWSTYDDYSGTNGYTNMSNLSDTSGAMDASNESIASASVNVSSGSATDEDPATSYVGSRGIREYSDGKVTDNSRFLGKNRPTSRTGAMASTFAAHMYKSSAERIFNTKQQRSSIKSQTSNFSRMSESFHDYKNSIHEANDNKQTKEFDRIMMKHKNLM